MNTYFAQYPDESGSISPNGTWRPDIGIIQKDLSTCRGCPYTLYATIHFSEKNLYPSPFTSTPLPTATITTTPNSFGMGTCWQTGQSWSDYTVTYDISTTIPANWVTGIENASQTWSSISISNFRLIRQTGSGNLVKKEVPDNPDWIASASPQPSSGPLTSSDVKLNPYKNFDDPNTAPYYVVENVMAHEFGHWLNLKHAYAEGTDCSDATMYEFFGPNGETIKIDLSFYDEFAAHYQYP